MGLTNGTIICFAEPSRWMNDKLFVMPGLVYISIFEFFIFLFLFYLRLKLVNIEIFLTTSNKHTS